MKKTILFIRHGESIANTGERTYCKEHDITLSDKGIQQAADMANQLQKPDLIIVSPYLRTVQTARPIMSKFPSVSIELWDSVHEFEPLSDFQTQGSTKFERKPVYHEYISINNCTHCNGIGAESFDSLINRVDYTLNKLRNMNLENIVIVSHFWFINAVLMRIKNPEQQMTPKYFEENILIIKNTEIVKVEL